MDKGHHNHIASDEKFVGREHFANLVHMLTSCGYKPSEMISCIIVVLFPDLTQYIGCFKYNLCDTESDLYRGWFGSGTETSILQKRIDL